MRHSLSDESTRAASVLGSWCQLPGAIPRDEIVQLFKDKSKRSKGKGRRKRLLVYSMSTLQTQTFRWLINLRTVHTSTLLVLEVPVGTRGYP